MNSKYNIGDIILWSFPTESQEISTIVRTHRDYDGTILYVLETYRANENKTISESYNQEQLDNIVGGTYTAPMAIHYPVKK